MQAFYNCDQVSVTFTQFSRYLLDTFCVPSITLGHRTKSLTSRNLKSAFWEIVNTFL